VSFEQVKARHRLAWGLDVDSYVKYTGDELIPVAEKLVEIADPKWDSGVIDIACGPGRASFLAARRVGPGGRVHGVDLAPPMVAWAERAAAAEGLTNVTFAVGDAEDLAEVPNDAFEAALSNFGIIFAPDAGRAVEEAARVLKPAGTLTLSVWVPTGMVAETFALLKSISPAPPEGASTAESWGEPGAAEARLAPLFGDIRVTPIDVPCEYASVDLAWQRMRDGRPPFALAYGRMPLEQKQDVEERAKAMLRAHAGEDGRVSYVRQAAIIKGVKKA
jgi:SAM-dependent methyltransferase